VNKPIRIYADTSGFGGFFDEEFSEPSRLFFQQIRSGRFFLVTSDVVNKELHAAPLQVQELFQEILPQSEIAEITAETLTLQQAYIDTGILPRKCYNDALHVALSTTSNCEGIISWNFSHIVHFQKIPLYNAVNIIHGYHTIFIHSPLEVIRYED